jgi:hypothetical protein
MATSTLDPRFDLLNGDNASLTDEPSAGDTSVSQNRDRFANIDPEDVFASLHNGSAAPLTATSAINTPAPKQADDFSGVEVRKAEPVDGGVQPDSEWNRLTQQQQQIGSSLIKVEQLASVDRARAIATPDPTIRAQMLDVIEANRQGAITYYKQQHDTLDTQKQALGGQAYAGLPVDDQMTVDSLVQAGVPGLQAVQKVVAHTNYKKVYDGLIAVSDDEDKARQVLLGQDGVFNQDPKTGLFTVNNQAKFDMLSQQLDASEKAHAAVTYAQVLGKKIPGTSGSGDGSGSGSSVKIPDDVGAGLTGTDLAGVRQKYQTLTEEANAAAQDAAKFSDMAKTEGAPGDQKLRLQSQAQDRVNAFSAAMADRELLNAPQQARVALTPWQDLTKALPDLDALKEDPKRDSKISDAITASGVKIPSVSLPKGASDSDVTIAVSKAVIGLGLPPTDQGVLVPVNVTIGGKPAPIQGIYWKSKEQVRDQKLKPAFASVASDLQGQRAGIESSIKNIDSPRIYSGEIPRLEDAGATGEAMVAAGKGALSLASGAVKSAGRALDYVFDPTGKNKKAELEKQRDEIDRKLQLLNDN